MFILQVCVESATRGAILHQSDGCDFDQLALGGTCLFLHTKSGFPLFLPI